MQNLTFEREKREITERELRRKQRKGSERMSRKCPLLSADNERETRRKTKKEQRKNERQMRERRNRDDTETRAKTQKEQRKNKETRRICSLIISRRIERIQRLKKGETGQTGHPRARGRNENIRKHQIAVLTHSTSVREVRFYV